MLGVVSNIAGKIGFWISLPGIAVGSASLLVLVICALVFSRAGPGRRAAVKRAGLIAFGAALTGSLTWACLEGVVMRGERSSLDARSRQLAAQTFAAGTPLACLDPLAGDAVTGACEKVVFASPESVAAATSYVASEFALLTDVADYKSRGGGADLDRALVPLRRTLEADPFGFLAHVLVVRDNCTSDNCPALALLHDPTHVRTNLIAQTLDHFVDHYREFWGKMPDASVAAVANAPTASSAEGGGPGTHKVVNIDFPSAASIPPISIMNPEPKGPAVPRAAGNAETPRTRRPATASAPDAPKVDPVWTPAPAQATQ
jgi:hypothetical protein